MEFCLQEVLHFATQREEESEATFKNARQLDVPHSSALRRKEIFLCNESNNSKSINQIYKNISVFMMHNKYYH
jgi:hypothetical protein